MELTDEDLKLLNSKIGLKHLLGNKSINLEKVLEQTKYEIRLREIQAELVKLQTWFIENGKKIVLVFHGGDASEKSGVIRRILAHNNPRHYRIEVNLPHHQNINQGEWYFKHYINLLPQPSEMVIYDRSWYNRALLEPVNGLCTEEEYDRFMEQVNPFEKMLVDSGIYLVKFYFTISKKEHARRLREMQGNLLTKWKLTPYDENAREKWDEYIQYKEKMFAHTNTPYAPWVEIKEDRREEEMIRAAEYILKTIPYQG